MHLRALVFSSIALALVFSLYGVPSAYATVETYNTPGSYLWTPPSGVTSVIVEAFGGGGGGNATSISGSGGGGGGGGAYSVKTFAVSSANSYNVVVGAGGAGGYISVDGTNGEDSYFGTVGDLLAKGGAAPIGASNTGGVGGLASGGVGDTKYNGGSGGDGFNPAGGGGGGGSSAGTGAHGNNGSNAGASLGGAGGTAPTGGAAGGAGGNPSISGSNGNNYGGGGGGMGSDGSIAGNGAGGKIVLTYGDTTAPTITNVSSDKANGTYTVGEVIDIDVTFSEAVTSTGNVTVTLETGATDRTCTFTVTGSTTGTCNYTVQSGDTSADLTVSTISGTIADAASNAMADFVPTTNLAANKALVIDTNVPDTTAPTIDTFSPVDNATSVTTTSNLVFTFNEVVTAVAAKNLTIKQVADDATVETIAVTGGLVSGSGTNSITVNPSTTLSDLTEYYVLIDSGAFIDTATNQFVGISSPASWNFTTAGVDSTAPELLTFTSTTSNGTYGPGSSIIIVATYNETLGSDSTITVTLDNGKKIPLSTVSGATLTGKYVVGATGSTESSSDLTVSSILSESVYDTSVNFRINSGVPENSHNLGDTSNIVIDTLAPNSSTFSPADNSADVNGSSNFVITFNEEVTAHLGNILIRRYSDNAIAATIGVATSQVTGVGTNTITINPNSTLANGTGYYIQVPNRAFKDRYGNFFAGFYTKTVWNFTTTGYLAVSSFSPPDNTKDVDVSSDFVITFTKPVFVSKANILIKRTSNNTTVAAINATSSQVTGSGTNTITINPNKNLVINTGYYIQIPTNAFKDARNNFYAGFTDKTIWNFTTDTGPVVSSFSPADNATDVNISSNLVLTFSKPVTVASANILIKRTSNNTTVAAINATSSQVTGSGTDTITINPNAFLPESTDLYIQIPATAFQDTKGNFYAGFTDKTIWNFVTNARPAVVSFSPADNATDVDIASDLAITFHKIVTVQTGNILLLRLDNDDVVESIDVTSSQIAGSGTKVLTINLNTELEIGTKYYIQIPATAIRDTKTNFFGGFVHNTVWNFATVCPVWNLFCARPDPTVSPTPEPIVTPTPEVNNPSPNPEPTPTPSPDDLPIDTPIVKIITFIKKVVAFVKELVVSPRTAIPKIQKALKPIIDSPVVKVITSTVTVAAVASVAASAGVLFFGAPTLLSEASQALRRIWQGILSFFGFNRKQRPWGRVLDADSGNAIPSASIQIYDHQAKQLKDTTLSNDRGAFSLVVPPGVYEFRVQKSGWVLTPKAPFLQLVAGEHIFDGKPVEVTKTRILPIVLAMKMTESVPIASYLLWRRAFQGIELFIARLSWPLLVFGVALNSFVVIVAPTKLNIVIEILYGVLVVWKIFLHFYLRPSVGLIKDAMTDKPLDLAVVRLYDAKNGRLVETRTTSHNGKFLLLPPLGVYTIMVVCSGYEPYRESHVVVSRRRESLALSFSLKKLV